MSAPAVAVELPEGIREEIVSWSLAGRPNEACGLIAGDGPARDGGKATRFIGLANAAESPHRYLLDAQEQLTVMLDLEERGEEVWGIVHSHVASPAEPSGTDVGLAFYPHSLYLICSLTTDPPHIRAWTIQGVAHEVELR